MSSPEADRSPPVRAEDGSDESRASAASTAPAAAARGRDAVWTCLDLIRWTHDYFARSGLATPRLDAEVLLAHVLGCGRIDLYLRFDQPVEVTERDRFRALVRARAQDRQPVAYLVGHREFWSHSFRVTPDVLIPRPDTETLVRAALERRDEPRRILDFGTGSGVIAGVLALELPNAEVVAIDCSSAALDVAADNLQSLGVADRVTLMQADSLDGLDAVFDLIVANPPYVPTTELDALEPELAWEPRTALNGGPQGLDVIRWLVPQALSLLAEDGCLLIEVGAGQAGEVERLMLDSGAQAVRVHTDLAGIERVVQALRSCSEEREESARC